MRTECPISAAASPLRRRAAARRDSHRLTPMAAAITAALMAGSSPVWAAGPLPSGTVPVLRGVVSGAVVGAPVQTATGNDLTITQTAQNAIIEWNSFNIANGSVVQFDQPSASAAALNRIYDVDPSIIQGKLLANGQVYLINQNGILFDHGSQVNVGGLVASTLNITNSTFLAGLTSPNQNGSFAPTFSGGYDASGNPTQTASSATIQIGAVGDTAANAPHISANPGGAILLVAPVINNSSGVITAPDGQVILAAGTSAYLFVPGSGPSYGYNAVGQGVVAQPYTGLRGFAVEVDATSGPVNVTSLIQNMGQISADRGNVTLAALAINQAGRVSATSSTLYNGSVYLQAGTISNQGGTVTLAAGSETSTPVDTTDNSTLSAAAPFTAGTVYLGGKTVDVEGNISAPDGTVYLHAFDGSDPSGSRVYIGPTGTVSAAGDWAQAPSSQNLATFKVTSNELANAPDQKGGILLGATVTVNLNAPSSILDLSGYQQDVQQSVAEKSSSGGSVNIFSQGDVITRPGSLIDVSGGGIHYAAGSADTTVLIGPGNTLYNINTAPENLTYTAIANQFTVNHPQWGQSELYNNILLGLGAPQPAVDVGSSAGSITINPGTALVLDGQMKAATTIGPTQLTSAPLPGSLAIAPATGASSYGVANLTFAAQAVDTLGTSFDVDSTLPQQVANQATLSASALGAGTSNSAIAFGSVNIDVLNAVTVPQGVNLTLPPGGTLSLTAGSIEIGGKISAPAGSIDLSTVLPTYNPAANVTLPAAPSLAVKLDAGALLDTAGLWLNNDTTDGAAVGPTLPFAVTTANGTASTETGGQITISSTDITTAAGSLIDVSGGAQMSKSGAIAGANAGSITITAPSGFVNSPLGTQVATSDLAGQLQGYSYGAKGGSLKIVAESATIAPLSDGLLSEGRNGTLALDPKFFQSGGFAAYDIDGAMSLSIASGVTLHPTTSTYAIDPVTAAALPTGSSLASVADVVLLPEGQRPATSIALRSTNPSGSSLLLPSSTTIETDPQGSITLQAAAGMTLKGKVIAPGGNVSLSVTGTLSPTGLDQAATTLELASGSLVSTAGDFVPAASSPQQVSLNLGTVVNGGTVSISTTNAALQSDVGSVLDVSGTSHAVDVSQSGPVPGYVLQTVGSNAGLVTITSTDGALLQGTILGHAGTAQNAGGSFALQLNDRNLSTYAPSYTLPRDIQVSQATPSAPANANAVEASVGLGGLEAGGFDKLHLTSEDSITFTGNVAGSFARGVTIDAPEFLLTGGTVSLSGSEVALQNSFGTRSYDTQGGTSGFNPYENNGPSTPVPTVGGTGVLTVAADNVDLFGSLTVNGASSVQIDSAHDIRLSGRVVGSNITAPGANLIGSLTTTGNVTLTATQVYPTTETQFSITVANQPDTTPGDATVVPGGQITIRGNGGALDPVLSAGGTLTLTADHIEQAGRLVAPLGSINLDASTSLTLDSGSVTSVSAAGLLIPFGETNAGVQWLYGPTNDEPSVNQLTAPPAKSITLSAPTIDQKSGSVVDVSGGGDILGVEFVPGSGGSNNILVAANTYAIMPAAQFATAPYDPDIVGQQNIGSGFAPLQNRDSAVYDSIKIGSGGAVPAGTYVLLPATYALLPGAYLVQIQSGSAYQHLAPNTVLPQANGTTVQSGTLTAFNTDVASQTTVGVTIQPGQNALKYSDFNLDRSSFFVTQAAQNGTPVPVLPSAGGVLSINATSSLSLGGSFGTAAVGGNTQAEVNLSAPNLAIVSQVGQAGIDPSYVQVAASQLSAIGGDLLIGGTRTQTSSGLDISSTADNVIVANSAASPLTAPDLIITAAQSIDFKPGSVAQGQGQTPTTPLALIGDSAGALVRLSNSGQTTLYRASPDSSAGYLDIESGATLKATGSMLLDATAGTQINGAVAVGAGGALSLDATAITLGDVVPGQGGSGLTLTNAQLAGFGALGQLTLVATAGIGVAGATEIGDASFRSVVLDTPSLTGTAGSTGAAPTTLIVGQSVALQNSSGDTATATTGTSGALTVQAGTLTVGPGSQAIGGYQNVNFNVAGDVTLAGTAQVDIAAPLSVTAGRLVGASGANQQWQTASTANGVTTDFGASLIQTAGAAAGGSNAGAGAQFSLTASSITDALPMVFHSGSIALASTGTGANDGVNLTTGAQLDVSGASMSFNGRTLTADAGAVDLTSATGINFGSGALIDVAGNAAGGNAGSVGFTAQTLALGGSFQGTATAGAVGGSANVDVASLSSFSDLNTALTAGGMNGGLSVRARSGDITVAASDVVSDHNVTLTADQGSVTVDGTIDASAANGGGSVSVYAGQNLTVGPGGTISTRATSTDASATGTYANGGSIDLEARAGTLTLAAGSTLDIRSGAKGSAGNVTLIASQMGGNTLNAVLQGTIDSASASPSALTPVVVLGNAVYNVSNPTAANLTSYANANQAFVRGANGAQILGGLRNDSGGTADAVLGGAVELDTAGNFTLGSALDLTSGGWAAAGGYGQLTIRAGGNVTLNQSLGNPSDALTSTPTWNIRIAAGADLSSANPLALQSLETLTANNTGNVSLPLATSKIRSGTGNIQIAAGNNFSLGNAQAVVYTSGLAAAPDVYGRWVTDGGNIDIQAQNSASGKGGEWITDWYRRQPARSGQASNTSWWADRSTFRDGVGSFGGGNITIAAGSDVSNLSAVSASSGQVNSSGTAVVNGGGDVTIAAGQDIVGGQYLVSLGTGTIKAGGTVGLTTPTELYLAGLGSDPALQNATINVTAGRGVNIQSIANPTALYLTTSVAGSDPSTGLTGLLTRPTYFTYGAQSGVDIAALSGDVSLGDKPIEYAGINSTDTRAIQTNDSDPVVAAPILNVSAWNGSIVGAASQLQTLVTYPSVQGEISLLASGTVANLNVAALDLAPASIPSLAAPGISSKAGGDQTTTTAADTLLSAMQSGAAPDRLVTRSTGETYDFDVQALTGNISSDAFDFPGVSRIWAEGSINLLDNVGSGITLENLYTSDVSLLQANTGSILLGTNSPIDIGGPGQLIMQAGGSINLGLSALTASGSQYNSSLPTTQSARLTLVAGVSGTVDPAELDTALAGVKAAGEATTGTPAEHAAAATAAINSFIGSGVITGGDIDSYLTSIQTTSNSGIDLIAPKGNITVGLTTPQTGVQIGAITNDGGAINSYLSGDFNINRGKVITAAGGDIMIFTTEGNIDAGRGAKTSITAPAPIPVKQANGTYTYVFSAGVSGSGIQTVATPASPNDPNPAPAGNIYLFAPAGYVNAGEAGITSGGNIVIFAQQVLNASNISAQGSAVGVPVVQQGSLASGFAISSGASGAGTDSAAQRAAEQAASQAAAASDFFKPSILTVEVLGFGDKVCRETDRACLKEQ